MLELSPRASANVEAMKYLYPSSAAQIADLVGGIVDAVTKEVYVPTTAGVTVASINSWLVSDGDGTWDVLTEAEVVARYTPVDVEAAVRVRGGLRAPDGWGQYQLLNVG